MPTKTTFFTPRRNLPALWVLLFAAATGCQAQQPGLAKADAFAQAMRQAGAQLLDVRTPEEFAQGHLPGAVNIDVTAAGFVGQIRRLDPHKPVLVYCHSGTRSQTAVQALGQMGARNIVELAGGISEWNGPVVR